jgi:hypothetical protein
MACCRFGCVHQGLDTACLTCFGAADLHAGARVGLGCEIVIELTTPYSARTG